MEDLINIFIDANSIGDRSIDNDQYRKEFYGKMKEYGFDFQDVDPISKCPKSMIPVFDKKNYDAYVKFNLALQKLHKENFSILDVVKFLITDYFEWKDLKPCIDEMNFLYLTKELDKKHNITDKKIAKSKMSMLG